MNKTTVISSKVENGAGENMTKHYMTVHYSTKEKNRVKCAAGQYILKTKVVPMQTKGQDR